jgi:hypothetical protein
MLAASGYMNRRPKSQVDVAAVATEQIRISWRTSRVERSLDDTMVAVICVSCGQQHSKPIRWFRDHTKLICNGCGCAIMLQNEQLRASIDELDRAMTLAVAQCSVILCAACFLGFVLPK